jgi:hypothetical protein
MPLITSYNSDSTEGKMLPTLNGISIFTVGPFYGQYGTGITVANSTTEWSWLYNQASSSTTNGGLVGPTPSTAVTAINMSSDPTGKGPGASLYLPGSGQLNVPTGPYGALSLGTIFSGLFAGSVGITSTPTIAFKIYLRNPLTGAVVYTLLSTTTTFAPSAGGMLVEPNFCVTAVGAAGSITAMLNAQGGTAGVAVTPTVTAVDTRQSYLLDFTATWSAQSSSDTYTINYGFFEAQV